LKIYEKFHSSRSGKGLKKFSLKKGLPGKMFKKQVIVKVVKKSSS